MKQITNFITEGLRINKDTKVEKSDILTTILNVIKPKLKEKVENYLKEWINKEHIENVKIYVQRNDYWKTLRNNDNNDYLIKMYNDVNDNNHPVINREVFNKTRNNWKFIGQNEGLGYWKNYFGYSVSGNKKIFTSTVYIVGIEN